MRIFLDSHSTTPVDPEVLDAMVPFFTHEFGNSASRHGFGWPARRAIEAARVQVAELIGACEKEIIFTSGATESNAIACLGSSAKHIITSNAEHSSILETCRRLEQQGVDITYLPVDKAGKIHPAQIEESIRPDTGLISIILANNEIGTVNEIKNISLIARKKNIPLHTDATQAVGRIPVDVRELGVDMLSLSGHKFHGPKGVGALFLRKNGPRPKPILFGGSQEQSLRPGTPNTPGIVGLGKACELARLKMVAESAKISSLRNKLQDLLTDGLFGVVVNGCLESRLPGNLSVSFEGVDTEILLSKFPEICISQGAACSSLNSEPSHVLRAIGLSEKLAQSTLRFGLHRFTTQAEIEYTATRIIASVKELRTLQ